MAAETEIDEAKRVVVAHEQVAGMQIPVEKTVDVNHLQDGIEGGLDNLLDIEMLCRDLSDFRTADALHGEDARRGELLVRRREMNGAVVAEIALKALDVADLVGEIDLLQYRFQ